MTLPHQGSNLPDMFERFTDRARRSLTLATMVAMDTGHAEVLPIHLLAGIAREAEGTGAQVLTELGVTYDAVLDAIPKGSPIQGSPLSAPLQGRTSKVLEYGLREALQLGHNYIGQEHLLLAILREGESTAARFLVESGHDLSEVRQAVVRHLSRSSVESHREEKVSVKASCPRRILYSRVKEGHELGEGWQYLVVDDYRHPLLHLKAFEMLKAKEAALRVLLEDEEMVEVVSPHGWKTSFKLESKP